MEALAGSNVAAAPKSAARPAAFELKGVMTSLAVLRLFSLDFAAIERQLRLKIEDLPQFFQDAPVVLDLGALSNGGAAVPFGPLKRLLRDCHLIPVAITNAGDDARVNAVAEGLGVMPYRAARAASRAAVTVTRSAEATPGPTSPTAPGPTSVPHRPVAEGPATVARPARGGRPALVIRQPVRSGQVIYAEQSDLVVLAPVNPGAEVIADGNVHLYGILRGRAIAGAQGYTAAQIFCQRLEAELVGVAGAYVMAEDIPADRRGHPARICLTDEGECRINAL
jgi:septum site-determining protein MinC